MAKFEHTLTEAITELKKYREVNKLGIVEGQEVNYLIRGLIRLKNDFRAPNTLPETDDKDKRQEFIDKYKIKPFRVHYPPGGVPPAFNEYD